MLKLKIHEWAVLALTFFAVAGFFLPWVKMNAMPSETLEQLAAEVARQLGAKEDYYLKDLLVLKDHQIRAANHAPFSGMTGYQLPGQINQRDINGMRARLALETFFGSKATEQKALLVYAYPLVAFASFLMLLCVRNNRRLFLIPSILALALYFWTRYRIATTELERSLIQVQIGWGIWICLYALLFIALIMIIFAFLPARFSGSSKKAKVKVVPRAPATTVHKTARFKPIRAKRR